MSKELLEPPDEKAVPPAPTDQPLQPPTRKTEPDGKKLVVLPPKGWRRLTRGRSLAGGSILVALLVVLVLLVGALSAPAKTSSTTTPNQMKQVQVPAHEPYNAQPPATPQGNTVNINLVVKETLISIAPGVAYHAWTFNGSVPGPILRVRQGQTAHFILTNDGAMPHSIDFHAAQTPWD